MTFCQYNDSLTCVVCGHVAQSPRTARKCGVTASRGPGTELKKLLARIGIVSSPDCSCHHVAAEMDVWGADECERPERINYVIAAMRDNAQRRGLPFLDAAGRLLVRRAIANARRLA